MHRTHGVTRNTSCTSLGLSFPNCRWPLEGDLHFYSSSPGLPAGSVEHACVIGQPLGLEDPQGHGLSSPLHPFENVGKNMALKFLSMFQARLCAPLGEETAASGLCPPLQSRGTSRARARSPPSDCSCPRAGLSLPSPQTGTRAHPISKLRGCDGESWCRKSWPPRPLCLNAQPRLRFPGPTDAVLGWVGLGRDPPPPAPPPF